MPGLKHLRYLGSLGKLDVCFPNQPFPYENTGVLIAYLSGSLRFEKCELWVCNLKHCR